MSLAKIVELDPRLSSSVNGGKGLRLYVLNLDDRGRLLSFFKGDIRCFLSHHLYLDRRVLNMLQLNRRFFNDYRWRLLDNQGGLRLLNDEGFLGDW